MTDVQFPAGHGGLQEATVTAVVTRCGCGDPMSHATLQEPCPSPRAVEPPIVRYWHRNPLRRFAWEHFGWRSGNGD